MLYEVLDEFLRSFTDVYLLFQDLRGLLGLLTQLGSRCKYHMKKGWNYKQSKDC